MEGWDAKRFELACERLTEDRYTLAASCAVPSSTIDKWIKDNHIPSYAVLLFSMRERLILEAIANKKHAPQLQAT